MKKQILLTAFLAATTLAVVKPEKSSAQLTGVTVSVFDSGSYACSLPANVYFGLNGTVTGTPLSSPDSVTVYVNWGDGTIDTMKVAESGQYGSGANHIYTIAGNYVPQVTVVTSDGNATASGQAATEVVTTTCSSVQGNVYTDMNNSGTLDAGDGNLSYMVVRATNTSVTPNSISYGWADYTGHYAMSLPSGYDYTIAPMYNSSFSYYWGYYGFSSLTPNTPASGSANITNLSGATTDNFGFNCVPPTATDSIDLYVSGWAQHFAPNDSGFIFLSAGDYWWDWSCNGLAATVTLTLSGHLTYVSTVDGPAPTSVVGQTLTWDLSSLSSSWYNIWSKIKVNCDANVTADTIICNEATISGTGFIDPYTANNSYDICHVANASWDPNEKQVAPDVDAAGTIANGTPLEYFIEFQNTGTAPAANVTITDAIDANLDINSVKIIKSSFANVQAYTENNVLKFRFNNINLPDMTTDLTGSTGFVTFRILPKPNLAPGTVINNKANIYFDYNPAVTTNITVNTIETPAGVQHIANASVKATVYPNPANELVTVKTDNKSDFTVSMTDMTGRIAITMQSSNGSAAINTHSLPSGIYFVKVNGTKGGDIVTKVSVQH